MWPTVGFQSIDVPRRLACAIPASIAVALLSVFPAVADPITAPLARETVARMSDQELIRGSIEGLSGRFVEVERPTFTGLAGPDSPVHGVRLATPPRSAGYPGLCIATVASVGFSGGSTVLAARSAFRIVGDLKPLPDMWNDAYGEQLEALCKKAGRVLPTSNEAFDEVGFFAISNGSEDYAWFGARALELAIAEARSGARVVCVATPGLDTDVLADLPADDPDAIEDRENRAACASPASVVSALTLDRLMLLDARPCPDLGKGRICAVGTFLRRAYFNRQVLWTVRVSFVEVNHENHDAGAVADITLTANFAVYD